MPCAVVRGRLRTPLAVYTQQTKPEQSKEVDGLEPPHTYIEPVATVPEHRGKGLGKAVVYEAVNRAKEQGAKRAIVLSDQDFYKRLGMIKSSEVGTWVKNSK